MNMENVGNDKVFGAPFSAYPCSDQVHIQVQKDRHAHT